MKRIIFLPILLLLLGSCRKYLNIDHYFSDEFDIDSVFQNTRNIEAYMWGAATLFPNEARLYRLNYTPGPLATDVGFNSYRAGGNVYYGLDFAAGITSPDYYGSGKPNLNQWGTYYKIIRKCNKILNHLDEPIDMTSEKHRYIEGYTRFIRAFAYYHIIIDYGPPILLGNQVISSNEKLESYDRERSTYDVAMDYICSEFKKAAKFLPLQVSIIDFGRPTKGAALALIARLRLIQASPLFNGGTASHTFFGNWTRKSDDSFYVSQTYDEKKWAVAAAAAKRVMELQGVGGGNMYKLYTVPADDNTKPLPSGVTSDPDYYNDFPDGAAGIDAFHSYKDIFDGDAVAAVNPEIIWGRKADIINTQLNIGCFPKSMGGWGRYSLTQKVIDAYLMDDGQTIDEARSSGYYSENGFTTSPEEFSGYRLNSGVYNMYDNREMRFYASVGFNEAVWPALSSSDDNNHTALYYYNAPDGQTSAKGFSDYSVTGYVLRKFVNPQDAFRGPGNRRVPKSFPIIRYAEILLSYAEALNNLTSSYTIDIDGQKETFSRDVNEIARAFDLVRYRAGLPGLSSSQLSDPNLVQKAIERERMVEFLWENRRYYDVRRWGELLKTQSEPMIGMNINGDKSSFYQRVVPNTTLIIGHEANINQVFVPIPRDEIQRLPSLDQNPGW